MAGWTVHVLLVVCLTGICHGQMYDRLYRDLLKNYIPTIPLERANSTLNVTVGLSLVDVLHVDTETGFVDLQMWIDMSWTDGRLSWDPHKFNKARTIRFPVSKIWIPDMELMKGEMTRKETKSLVLHDGNMFLSQPTNIRVRCGVTQSVVKCRLVLFSWTYDISYLDLNQRSTTGIDLSNYAAVDWSVESASAERTVTHYACCSYPELSFTLVLRKKKGWFDWLS